MTNDFDLKAVRKQLHALRTKHGAHSQIGGICSNLIEQLQNYPTLPMDRRKMMEKFIAKSVAELARLTGSASQ